MPTAPLLHNEETKAKTIRKDPCDSKGYTHTQTDTHFELGFSVILSCHDGKEGEGTERCRSPQNSIVLKKFSKGLEKDLYRLANSRAVG